MKAHTLGFLSHVRVLLGFFFLGGKGGVGGRVVASGRF